MKMNLITDDAEINERIHKFCSDMMKQSRGACDFRTVCLLDCGVCQAPKALHLLPAGSVVQRQALSVHSRPNTSVKST